MAELRYWVVYASLPLERPVFLLPRPLVTSSAQLLNKCFSPKSPITFGPLKGEAQQKSYRASSVNSELQRGRACTKHAGKEALGWEQTPGGPRATGREPKGPKVGQTSSPRASRNVTFARLCQHTGVEYWPPLIVETKSSVLYSLRQFPHL